MRKIWWFSSFCFFLACEPASNSAREQSFLVLFPLLQGNQGTPSTSSSAFCITSGIPTNAFLANQILASPGSDPGTLNGDPNLATNGICGGGEFVGSVDVYSLNPPNRNFITLGWQGKIVVNTSGIDFIVFENPFRYQDRNAFFIEPLVVEVSLDDSTYCGWDNRYTGSNTSDDNLLLRENWPFFAGKSPVLWNQRTKPLSHAEIFSQFDSMGSSLTAGGDGFDLDQLVPEKCNSTAVNQLKSQGFRYLRLTSGISLRSSLGITIPPGNFSGGPDVDGVLARSTQN